MLKRIWNWISHLSNAWGLLPSAIATSVATALWVGVMGIFGYLEKVPIFWIMLGLPLAGASIFTFILRVSEWRTRISAAGKLLFQGANLGGGYKKNSKGKIIAIENAQVRLLLQSTASFPISFIVDEFQTSFEGKFPPNKPRTDTGGMALANEVKVYTDHLIELKNEPIKEHATGTVKFKVRYGHPGREKYGISHNLRFETHFKESEGYVVVAVQEIL